MRQKTSQKWGNKMQVQSISIYIYIFHSAFVFCPPFELSVCAINQTFSSLSPSIYAKAVQIEPLKWFGSVRGAKLLSKSG